MKKELNNKTKKVTPKKKEVNPKKKGDNVHRIHHGPPSLLVVACPCALHNRIILPVHGVDEHRMAELDVLANLQLPLYHHSSGPPSANKNKNKNKVK